MIIVVNKKTHTSTNNDVYIGRGSPLGNPYPLPQYSREASILEYSKEFHAMMKEKKDQTHLRYTTCREQLLKIWRMSKNGTVYLLCFCKPLTCHGDVIKEFLDSLSI